MANQDNHMTNTDKVEASGSALAASRTSRSGWKTHLLIFAVTVLVVWGVGAIAAIAVFPHLIYNGLENSAVQHGIGCSESAGIPLNTLYTTPTLAAPSPCNSLLSTGNHDTLYTVGLLDLSKGPVVLHTPDMAGRYYAVQLTDSSGTDFAYVGRRTTGTQAGDYLITGPGWQGTVPAGITRRIAAPDNTVLVIGRTLVKSDSDLATAYGLAKQIQVTPLSQWKPGQ